MKKIISALLVLVIIAGLGFGGWKLYDYAVLSNPEKLIIGEWKTENELLYYTFNDDGTMSGKIDLPLIGNVSIDGTYAVDRELNQLTLTYSFGSLSYNDVKTVTIEDNVLTVTNTNTNIQTVYYKVTDKN